MKSRSNLGLSVSYVRASHAPTKIPHTNNAAQTSGTRLCSTHFLMNSSAKQRILEKLFTFCLLPFQTRSRLRRMKTPEEPLASFGYKTHLYTNWFFPFKLVKIIIIMSRCHSVTPSPSILRRYCLVLFKKKNCFSNNFLRTVINLPQTERRPKSTAYRLSTEENNTGVRRHHRIVCI